MLKSCADQGKRVYRSPLLSLSLFSPPPLYSLPPLLLFSLSPSSLLLTKFVPPSVQREPTMATSGLEQPRDLTPCPCHRSEEPRCSRPVLNSTMQVICVDLSLSSSSLSLLLLFSLFFLFPLLLSSSPPFPCLLFSFPFLPSPSLSLALPVLLPSLSGLIVPEAAGNETVPEVVTTSGYALLHFFSDAAYNLTGFNIFYSYVCVQPRLREDKYLT